MGFFDKMKAMKNAVTGGAAKVYLECEELSYDDPFKVTIKAQTGDATVKVDNIYLLIEGREEVEVPDVDVVYDEDGDEHRRRERVYASCTSISLRIKVADQQELEANQSYEWEVDVKLPENSPKIFRGRYAEHGYRAQAGLDCFGNDPDSGWIELDD
ncbi:MAG: sporulation protein [Alteromonadales bacterium]|nr:sporulation protein [Alteromonadales bacterium]